MNDKLYNPIVITGPSGSGKTELIDYVEKNYSGFMEADPAQYDPVYYICRYFSDL